ncbi:hypothetical protein OXIME_000660 [Oxyplasma meridianum]|uniref:Cytochrome oxidase subunit II copper A binding domain-containing protein n=1 Tax=Oxyplasma meridianum TaxID=3073602 RepID=A0AAX4NF75_9ARCH
MEDRILIVFTVAVILAGIGGGIWVVHQPDMANASPVIDHNPYNITLVIQHGVIFNASTGTQPSYFILQNGSLHDASNLYLPADRVINLILIDFDNGPSPLMNPNMNTVLGTMGGHVYVTGIGNIQNIPDINHEMTKAQFMSYYNNNDSSALRTLYSEVNSPSFFSNSTSVSSLPSGNIAHTFTVSSFGLNIPSQAETVTHAQFVITSGGTAVWQCEAECGSGSLGLNGAMATPGWMLGTVTVT